METLAQKLDTAEKTIDQYSRLIASLSAELKRYQDIICYPCKEKIFLASYTAPTPIVSERTSSGSSGTSVAAGPPLASAPSLASHDRPSKINQSGRVDSSGARDKSNLDDLIPATSSIDNRLAVCPYSTDAHTDHPKPTLVPISENATKTGPTKLDWSVEYNPEIKQTFSLHVTNTFTFAAGLNCTKFSCDGNYLAVGLENGETHIHDMVSGSTSILAERSATVFYTEEWKRLSAIEAVRFSQDNKYIATGGSKGQINVIWEIGRRRVRASFKHTRLVGSLDFSPDGRFLVSASFDKSVCMWRIRDGSRKVLWDGRSNFMSVAFSPDGRSVAAGNADGLLTMWDARTGRLVARCTIADFGRANLRSIAFTPDGRGIASGSNALRCWDVSSLIGRRSGRRTINEGATNQMKQIWEFKRYKGVITAVAFSSDNPWVISSSVDRDVCILDARTGSWLCTLKGHMESIWGADFSPAGRYIVSGSGEGLVRLWRYDMNL